MSRVIFKIRIKVHEKADLLVIYAINKSQPFLELKTHVRYHCTSLFSTQTGKVGRKFFDAST